MNKALARKVRKIITDNPERHDQTILVNNMFTPMVWKLPVEAIRKQALKPIPDKPANKQEQSCGTIGCVAGWAAIYAAPRGSLLDFLNFKIVLPNGGAYDIEYYAREKLGLTWEQGKWLFSGFRSRSEILAGLDYLMDHPDADSEDLLNCEGE